MMNTKSKKAFSMVTAIFVIVIMASISLLIMNVSGKTVKSTTQQYQKEQAQLLARSYTELALLYVIHYDRSAGDCLESISDHFGDINHGYDIKMNIKYIGRGGGSSGFLSNCRNNIELDGSYDLSNTNATWTNTGQFYDTVSFIVDTYVSYKDFDDPSNRNVTFHRRTVQKL